MTGFCIVLLWSTTKEAEAEKNWYKSAKRLKFEAEEKEKQAQQKTITSETIQPVLYGNGGIKVGDTFIKDQAQPSNVVNNQVQNNDNELAATVKETLNLISQTSQYIKSNPNNLDQNQELFEQLADKLELFQTNSDKINALIASGQFDTEQTKAIKEINNQLQTKRKQLTAQTVLNLTRLNLTPEDEQYKTVDGISYEEIDKAWNAIKSVDEKKRFWNAANNVYKQLKKGGADIAKSYKQIETLVQILPAVTVGALSGINATYVNVGSFGKVTLAVSTAVPLAGEGLYYVLVSTESGIKKTVKMAGSIIMSIVLNKYGFTNLFKNSWSNEMLKHHGQNRANVEIIATILRAMEGVGYSKISNTIIDEYDGNFEKFLEGKDF